MENKTNTGSIEKKALSRVPDNERQKWYSIAFIWIGTMICIPMLMVGGLLSASMTFGNVLFSGEDGRFSCGNENRETKSLPPAADKKIVSRHRGNRNNMRNL